MLIFTKLILVVFCLGILAFIFDCQRAVSSSESVLVRVPTATLRSIFYSFAFPCLSNIVVTRSETQLVGVDRQQSMEQTHSGADERTCNQWNPRVRHADLRD